MNSDDALELVDIGLASAEAKHPVFMDDLRDGAGVVSEESGELWQAVMDYREGKGSADDIRTEAIHTAVAAIRMATCMDVIIQNERKAQDALTVACDMLRESGDDRVATVLAHYFKEGIA